MEKIFNQFKSLILNHKKRLIYTIFALFIGIISFFGINGIGIENSVFAADKNTSTQNTVFQEKAKENAELLSFVKKTIYVLIYPMLVVAGKLVDNSFVYGEVFNFDTALWNLWNMARNLANYTLGFLFVYKVFEFLIKGQKSSDMKKILISSLIAGIGIQASWFIMMALIDVSTVLAYSIGGLPITILNDGKDITAESLRYDPYVLKTVLYVDVDDVDTINMYLTNTDVGDKKSGQFYISECETVNFKYDGNKSEELIVAPKMIYYAETGANEPIIKSTMNPLRCHYGGQVYYFGGLYEGIVYQDCSTIEDCKTKQDEYGDKLKSAMGKISSSTKEVVIPLINDAKLLELGNSHTSGGLILGTQVYGTGVGLDVDNERTGQGGVTWRLHDILEGKSYVGIFTLLYSSLISSGKNIIPQDTGSFGDLLSVVLSLGYLIAIAIPLIVVAIVFIIRIGILWMAISLSPFIALFSAFKDIGDKIFKSETLQYFKLENLIPIIFSPAIICFAISLSTVLVTIINFELNIGDRGEQDILGGLITLNIGGLPLWMGRFVMSVFGVVITWFLVRTAVETSKIGKSKFIGSLKSLARNAIGSIPVVPIPGKNFKGVEFIGLDKAFGLGDENSGIISKVTDKIKTNMNNKSEAAIDQWINGNEVETDAVKKRMETYTSRIGGWSQVPDMWTNSSIQIGEHGQQKITFNDFDTSQKKEIIGKINGFASELREKFGSSQPEVKIDDNHSYQFDVNDKKYVEKSNS